MGGERFVRVKRPAYDSPFLAACRTNQKKCRRLEVACVVGLKKKGRWQVVPHFKNEDSILLGFFGSETYCGFAIKPQHRTLPIER